MLRIFHNTTYHFIRHWRIAVAATVAFIVAGALSFLIQGPINYSIEFTGGTLMQLRFNEAPDVAKIRSTLNDAGIPGVEIQQYGSNTEYTIRAQGEEQVQAQDAGASNVAIQIENAMRTSFGEGTYTVVRSEGIGPRVGGELRTGAMIAIALASLMTLAYMAVRFDWRFGISAVISSAHDILVALAFIKLMNLEVSLTVVAALLTLLGYSANDTIIIFDRVRENLRKQRKGETLSEVLDRSINETLPRTIMTHLTTIAATLALLIFAGEVIRPFAWIMTFGVLVATFSSMYVAGPFLIWMETRYPRKASEAAGRAMRAEKEGAAATRQRTAEKAATR